MTYLFGALATVLLLMAISVAVAEVGPWPTCVGDPIECNVPNPCCP
jgi:hypothetical protein